MICEMVLLWFKVIVIVVVVVIVGVHVLKAF